MNSLVMHPKHMIAVAKAAIELDKINTPDSLRLAYQYYAEVNYARSTTKKKPQSELYLTLVKAQNILKLFIGDAIKHEPLDTQVAQVLPAQVAHKLEDKGIYFIGQLPFSKEIYENTKGIGKIGIRDIEQVIEKHELDKVLHYNAPTFPDNKFKWSSLVNLYK